jgi:hypothetical protein
MLKQGALMVFNKCYPPQVDGSEFLPRRRILENFMPRGSAHPAPLIKPYLSPTGLMAAWYQVGPDDADPVLFLNSVSTCIKRCFEPALSDAVVLLPDADDFKVAEHDLRNRLKDHVYVCVRRLA